MIKQGVHHIAATGFSERSAQLYDASRPAYAPDALSHVSSLLGDNPSLLVELGAGTGKFTKSFVPLLSKCTNRVTFLATEPSSGFRGILEKDAREDYEAVNLIVKAGTSEWIPVPTAHTVDGVIVAQAFHWMANDLTLKEIHRVLRPNSPLVLIWNILDTDIPWVRVLEENIIDKYYSAQIPEVPRYLTMKWQNVFETPEGKKLFRPPACWFGGYQRRKATRQLIVDRVLSISVIQSLDSAGQKAVVDQIEELLKTHPSTRTLKDGEYDLVYKTHVSVAYPISSS